MAQMKRWRPCPMAGRQNACKQRFWCHDRPRSEKNGRFGYARGVFHEGTKREPRAYFSDPVNRINSTLLFLSSKGAVNGKPRE
eukprot:scaffold58244_cov63-Phaeocystis_antarctica.AAC.1